MIFDYPSKATIFHVFQLQIKIKSHQKSVERFKFTALSDPHFLLTGSTSTIIEVNVIVNYYSCNYKISARWVCNLKKLLWQWWSDYNENEVFVMMIIMLMMYMYHIGESMGCNGDHHDFTSLEGGCFELTCDGTNMG